MGRESGQKKKCGRCCGHKNHPVRCSRSGKERSPPFHGRHLSGGVRSGKPAMVESVQIR
jgi:hypothetical protein